MIRELNTWHAIIEHGRKEWGIDLPENPVHLVKRPKADPARERRLEPTDGEGMTEEDWLLAACDSDRDPWMGGVARLAIETAMRQGEILGLKWADVDFRKSVALLRDTKNGDRRVVPLSNRRPCFLGEEPLLPTTTASVLLFLNGGTTLIEQCGDVSLDVLQNFSRKGRCSLRDRP